MFVFPPRGRLTDGERNFYIAMIGLGVLGALLAHVTIMRFASEIPGLHGLDPMALWVIIAGLIGGVGGFFSCYRTYLGHEGFFGWMRALFGGVIITGLGAVISGTLILPFYGTMFAPFQIVISMIEYPVLAVVWAAVLMCAHLLMRQWRRERDSIFAVVHEPHF